METGNLMSQSSKREYLKRIHPRYQKADATVKQRILDEFCANYGSRLVAIWKAVWEAADYPWSGRRKALLPEWMPWIRRRFRLTPETEGQRLAISACPIDNRLGPYQRRRRRL